MTGDNENTPPDGADEDIIEAEVIEDTEITDVAIRTAPVERKIHKVRRWLLKTALVLAVLGLLIYLVAALGYRLGILDLKTALMTLPSKVGPVVFIAGIIVSLLSLGLSWFVDPKKGLLLSLIAFAIPLGGLLKGLGVQNKLASLPAIHDITTDSENPPKFTQTIIDLRAKTDGVNTLEYLEKKDKPDGRLVSLLQYETEAYRDIDTVQREERPAVVYGEAKKLIGTKGWTVVTEDEENWILEATDTTFWYGFKDDIVIRIQPSRNGGSLIDMRSVSRIGRSDLGANAERIIELIKELEGD